MEEIYKDLNTLVAENLELKQAQGFTANNTFDVVGRIAESLFKT
jgi:hypothetical protein